MTSGLLAHEFEFYLFLNIVNLRNSSQHAKREIASGSVDPHVVLTEADIPGADL